MRGTTLSLNRTLDDITLYNFIKWLFIYIYRILTQDFKGFRWVWFDSRIAEFCCSGMIGVSVPCRVAAQPINLAIKLKYYVHKWQTSHKHEYIYICIYIYGYIYIQYCLEYSNSFALYVHQWREKWWFLESLVPTVIDIINQSEVFQFYTHQRTAIGLGGGPPTVAILGLGAGQGCQVKTGGRKSNIFWGTPVDTGGHRWDTMSHENMIPSGNLT